VVESEAWNLRGMATEPEKRLGSVLRKRSADGCGTTWELDKHTVGSPPPKVQNEEPPPSCVVNLVVNFVVNVPSSGPAGGTG
jgi:hypothetical protein